MDIELRIMKEREKLEIGNSALKIQRLILVAGMALLISDLCRPTLAVDWYVATNGTGLGTNGWANATNNLQGLITNPAVIAGDTIWVSNGVYDSGGITNYPSGSDQTTRVVITKAITLQSQNNDPTNTIIKGAWHPITTNGQSAVRCVYMAADSTLIGFTLTNGATLSPNSSRNSGGGVYCPSITPVISNCIITGNSAYYAGGGAYYGTLRNCTLTANFAWGFGGGGTCYSVLTNCTFIGNYAFYSSSIRGGGAYYSTLYNCVLISNNTLIGNSHGGGAGNSKLFNCTLIGNRGVTYGGATIDCTLSNCTLTSNYGAQGGAAIWGTLYNCTMIGNSAGYGGGTEGSTLYNCFLAGNSVSYNGGGADACTLYNCTLVGNRAGNAGGGGGAYGSTLSGCIIYFNNASSASNWASCTFTNSCTAPSNSGWAVGNIVGDPMFVNTNIGNYRLSSRSPCVNAGTNFSWVTNSTDLRGKDLDGRPRVKYGTVDMGAYEHIRAGTIYGVR